MTKGSGCDDVNGVKTTPLRCARRMLCVGIACERPDLHTLDGFAAANADRQIDRREAGALQPISKVIGIAGN